MVHGTWEFTRIRGLNIDPPKEVSQHKETQEMERPIYGVSAMWAEGQCQHLTFPAASARLAAVIDAAITRMCHCGPGYRDFGKV